MLFSDTIYSFDQEKFPRKNTEIVFDHRRILTIQTSFLNDSYRYFFAAASIFYVHLT